VETPYHGQAAITIQAPAELVFAYLADFERHPEWAANLGRVAPVTPGAAGVGATFKTQEGPPPAGPAQRLRMLVHFLAGVLRGAKTYSTATITALEPPRRIAWQGGIPKGQGFFNRAEWEFLLEPRGAATHLTQRFRLCPQEPGAEHMVRALGPAGWEQAVAFSLLRLKHRLESAAAERS
jgi:uncharacterized protein YndB with AHSA1/START domain